MAGVVVELTGDEAKLLASMQKVIAQNAKTGDSFKGMGGKAKEAADVAVKEQQRVERDNKKSADMMYAEHKKMLDNKAGESRRAGLAAEALARKTAFAEVNATIKAAERQIQEAEKVASKKRKLAEDFEKQNTSLGSQVFDRIAGSIDASTIAIGAFAIGVKMVADEQQRIVDLQNEQLGISNKLAAAQQEATKNLVGMEPGAMKELVEGAPQRIALDASFSDLPALTKALGSAASIVGNSVAETVTSTAAKLSSLTPEQLEPTTQSLSLVVQATGVTDAREAMSLLLSAGSVATPENLPRLSEGAAKAINAGVVSTSGTQTKIDAAKESTSLFAMLTEVDPKGNSSATAAVDLISDMREIFGKDKEATDKRDDKIDSLSQTRERNLDQKDNLTTQIEIKTKQAAKFKDADKSPAAESARLTLTNAKSSLERLVVSSASTDKQLAALEDDRKTQQTRVDPGTTLGRLEAVSKDPKLREQYLSNMKGEAIFKPLFEGLVTPGSDQRKKLAASSAAVTTDVSVFENAMKTQDLTAPQRIARTEEKSKAITAVQQTDTSNAEVIAGIRKIRDRALNETTLPSTIVGRMSRTMFPDSLNTMVDGPENVKAVARQAEQSLSVRISEAEESFIFRGPNKEEKSQIDSLKAQRGLIIGQGEMAAKPGALDRLSAPIQADTVNALNAQNEVMKEQNLLLKTIAENTKPNGKTPNTPPDSRSIRAMAEQGANQ